MPNFTRNEADLLGTVGSPTSIAAAGTNNATLATTGSTVARGGMLARVIIGSSAPTTSPTVQFQLTYDATNYINDGGAIQVPLTVSTSFDYVYSIPPEAKGGKCIITNGATNAITCFIQGNTLAIT